MSTSSILFKEKSNKEINKGKYSTKNKYGLCSAPALWELAKWYELMGDLTLLYLLKILDLMKKVLWRYFLFRWLEWIKTTMWTDKAQQSN